MKKLALLCAVVAIFGCSRDADVGSFVAELDEVTAEVVKKISSGDVAGAKAYFEAKKAGLAVTIAAIKKTEAQMPKADGDKLVASVEKDLKALEDAIDSRKRMDAGAKDTVEQAKALDRDKTMGDLERDFKDLFK